MDKPWEFMKHKLVIKKFPEIDRQAQKETNQKTFMKGEAYKELKTIRTTNAGSKVNKKLKDKTAYLHSGISVMPINHNYRDRL